MREIDAMGAPTRIALIGILLLLVSAPASWAHPLAPSLLDVREVANGRFEVLWRTPQLRASGVELVPRLPDHCETLGRPVAGAGATDLTLRWQVDCGESGIIGDSIGVEGMERSRTVTLLRIANLDGSRTRMLLDAENPSWQIKARGVRDSVFMSYLALGFDHILSGPDHLLFVLGLLLLIRGRRRLLAAVTAFTLGHSLTLALATLDLVRFPTSLVEVAIAMSLVVVALELCDTEQTVQSRIRRRPWLIAFSFGLLHGLGFAGALQQVGLPGNEIPEALLSFNIGIEFGQLVFIAGILVAARIGAKPLAWVQQSGPLVQRMPGYAIGSCAMYWVIERGMGALI